MTQNLNSVLKQVLYHPWNIVTKPKLKGTSATGWNQFANVMPQGSETIPSGVNGAPLRSFHERTERNKTIAHEDR